jgi:hypothetical protein
MHPSNQASKEPSYPRSYPPSLAASMQTNNQSIRHINRDILPKEWPRPFIGMYFPRSDQGLFIGIYTSQAQFNISNRTT